MKSWIETVKKEFGVLLTKSQQQQFETLRDFLISENKKYNLTSITDPKEIEIKHFLDSLSLAPILPQKPTSIIDIGSGAGFPGLAIAIIRPDISVTCLEATGKKIAFIQEIAKILGLQNVSLLHARAEEAGHDPRHREMYDIAVTRAVALLPIISEYALPFVRIQGTFIAMKSKKEPTEQTHTAIEMLGGTISTVQQILVPELTDHTLVVINKNKTTPSLYPRRTGIPEKRPL